MSFEILKGAFDLGVLFEVVAVNSLGTSQLVNTKLEFVLETYYLFGAYFKSNCNLIIANKLSLFL